MSSDYRIGRTKKLSPHQKYFKSEWVRLEKVTLSGKPYITDVARWICNCGRQKYSAYHLCKHLVQAVPRPPRPFWNRVHRRRTIPLYRDPALVAHGAPPSDYVEPDSGNISDGDDNFWSGDPKLLQD
ncbi:hypothetical protein BD626DRAFT_415283, partial [Schizophyllum amplum]